MLNELNKLEGDCLKILCFIWINLNRYDRCNIIKNIKNNLKLYDEKTYQDIINYTNLKKSIIINKFNIMKKCDIIDIINYGRYANVITIIPSKEVGEFLNSLKYRDKSKDYEEYVESFKILNNKNLFYKKILKLLINNMNKYNLSWDFNISEICRDNNLIKQLEQEKFIEIIRGDKNPVYIIKEWAVNIINGV